MSEHPTENTARQITQELVAAFRELGLSDQQIREELRGIVRALRQQRQDAKNEEIKGQQASG